MSDLLTAAAKALRYRFGISGLSKTLHMKFNLLKFRRYWRIEAKTRRRDLMYCRCVRYSLPSPAILCCLIIMMLQSYIFEHNYAAADGVRTMSGIVAEVLTDETPPVIMVRSKPGMKDEVVVGAVVKKGASILRGKRPIALHHIRAGEKVTLTYMKQRDGLTVRSIVVHPR